MRAGRIVAVAGVLLAMAPSLAGMAGAATLSTGNGRAEQRERPIALPGEARTEARLLQFATSKLADRGITAVDLGQITAEAAKAGGLFSELLIEGLRVGEQAVPTIAFHSDHSEERAQKDQLTVTVKDDKTDSSLALADWYLNSGDTVGAVSRFDLLSGTVGVPGLGLKANLGERGFMSEVTKDKASARFALSVEDLRVTLESLLPDLPLPLGTSLTMITQLQLPLGETTGKTVAHLVKLLQDLALVSDTLDDIDQARDALGGMVAGSPAAQAALATLEAAEAAAAQAAVDLAAATAAVEPARVAANTAVAARDAAEAALAAAQQDVVNATSTVNGLQAQVNALAAEVAALQNELATTSDPLRLLALPGEIAAKQAAQAAAAASLSSAEAARTNLVAILVATETSTLAKRATASAAQAALSAAEGAAASAATAAANAQAALAAAQSGADAALAAAAVNQAALGAISEEYQQAKARLHVLLQSVSDLIELLPPLPIIEQELDEALRQTDMLNIGGVRLETVVEASARGTSNLVHCKLEDVTVLGWKPAVEECTDLIAVEKEAVRRVNEVLKTMGAVGVEGIQILGPGGTWTEPGPVGPDGVAHAEGQMSALTLKVPEVRLDGIAANALERLAPLVAMVQERPVSGIALPTIQPTTRASQLRTMALDDEAPETESQTLGEQLQQVGDEMDKLNAPDSLQGASTGSMQLVVAQARSVAEYDVNRAKKLGINDPTSVCGSDPVCLAKCAAGQCPSAAGDTPAGANGPGAGSGSGPGGSGGVGPGSGSGSDGVGLPVSSDGSGKLPMTGAAGGLTAVALLAMGGAGARWVRRRPHP